MELRTGPTFPPFNDILRVLGVMFELSRAVGAGTLAERNNTQSGFLIETPSPFSEACHLADFAPTATRLQGWCRRLVAAATVRVGSELRECVLRLRSCSWTGSATTRSWECVPPNGHAGLAAEVSDGTFEEACDADFSALQQPRDHNIRTLLRPSQATT